MLLALVAVLNALSKCGPEAPVWPVRFTIEQRKIPDDRASGNSSVTTYYDSVVGANLLLITADTNKSDTLWDLEVCMTSQVFIVKP